MRIAGVAEQFRVGSLPHSYPLTSRLPIMRRPRLLSAVKWIATVAAAGLCTLLLFTCLFAGNWQPRPGVFRAIEPGYFCLEEISVPRATVYGWHRTRSSLLALAMWFGISDGPRGSWITVPVLGPALVSGAIAGLAWRLEAAARRRAERNLCSRCGYDREGLAAGAACPECGREPGEAK